MRIGIDFDNTIIRYDSLLLQLASEKGYLEGARGAFFSKQTIRDQVRLLDDGEIKWQKLQAEAYGDRIDEAPVFDGVMAFLEGVREKEIALLIISHKTRFASQGSPDMNLRHRALSWLKKQRILSSRGISEEAVYFEDTRAEKIERIRKTECSHFIDDLRETFSEPAFPETVVKILFDPFHESVPADPGLIRMGSWNSIKEYVIDAWSSLT